MRKTGTFQHYQDKNFTATQINKKEKNPPISSIKTFRICTERVQNDTGANQVVTNIKHISLEYKDIFPYPIGGVKLDDVAIICIG